MCSFARQITLEGVGPSRSGQHVITDRHTCWHTPVDTHVHTYARAHTQTHKCSIESVVYPVSLRAAQEKLHETLCLLQRSARLRADLTWIHLSVSWPDLTWMSRSLVSGPRVLLFLSLQFLFKHRAPYCFLVQTHGQRCESTCAPLCIHGGVSSHI